MKITTFNPDGNTMVKIEIQIGDVLVYKRRGMRGCNRVTVLGFTEKRIRVRSADYPEACAKGFLIPDVGILNVSRDGKQLSGEPVKLASSKVSK